MTQAVRGDDDGGDAVGRRADALPAKRDQVLTLRVTALERRRIERVAKRHGIGLSALLRAAALDLDDDTRVRSGAGAEDLRPELASTEEQRLALLDLRQQYKGVHSNVNQLTRLSHRAGMVQPSVVIDGDEVALVALLLETKQLAHEVLVTLGARGAG